MLKSYQCVPLEGSAHLEIIPGCLVMLASNVVFMADFTAYRENNNFLLITHFYKIFCLGVVRVFL